MFEKRIIEKLKRFNEQSRERFIDDLTMQELAKFFQDNLKRICKQGEEFIFLTPEKYSELINEYDMQESDEFIELPQLKGYLL